jgi:hypothetical protein
MSYDLFVSAAAAKDFTPELLVANMTVMGWHLRLLNRQDTIVTTFAEVAAVIAWMTSGLLHDPQAGEWRIIDELPNDELSPYERACKGLEERHARDDDEYIDAMIDELMK